MNACIDVKGEDPGIRESRGSVRRLRAVLDEEKAKREALVNSAAATPKEGREDER